MLGSSCRHRDPSTQEIDAGGEDFKVILGYTASSRPARRAGSCHKQSKHGVTRTHGSSRLWACRDLCPQSDPPAHDHLLSLPFLQPMQLPRHLCALSLSVSFWFGISRRLILPKRGPSAGRQQLRRKSGIGSPRLAGNAGPAWGRIRGKCAEPALLESPHQARGRCPSGEIMGFQAAAKSRRCRSPGLPRRAYWAFSRAVHH